MTGEDQADLEHFELRLPLWAVTDAEALRKRGLPDALREFHHDVHGRFLDLFTREDIADGYLHQAGLTRFRAVALETPEQLYAVVVAFQERGCACIGLNCTDRLGKNGRFFTIHQFLALIDRIV
jgi:hypothetical protein